MQHTAIRDMSHRQAVVTVFIFIALVGAGVHVNDAAVLDGRIDDADNTTTTGYASSVSSSGSSVAAAAYSGTPSIPSTGLFPTTRKSTASPTIPT